VSVVQLALLGAISWFTRPNWVVVRERDQIEISERHLRLGYHRIDVHK
jgi:hypothetical protein